MLYGLFTTFSLKEKLMDFFVVCIQVFMLALNIKNANI